ncbi:MAG TPA: helix-turn-helix domain-containing protein [Bryobacteraceae bacterium]|nr:helix-turn-helix domain-containing protein [Bryobacteraceae bacterium]
MSYREIERKLGASAPTVSLWKGRFEQSGTAGLQGQHKGSKPRVATPVVQAKSTVQRVLGQAKLKPHRLERYMASNDPRFEEKAADIIGLYMNPPQHAAVFCVEEKTAIQAMDRLDPVLPLSHGRAERHGYEYYRHGTLSLYAALEVKTGKVDGKTAARHNSAEFVDSLTGLVSKARWAKEYQANPKVRAYAKSARPIRWTYTDPKRRIGAKAITGTVH